MNCQAFSALVFALGIVCAPASWAQDSKPPANSNYANVLDFGADPSGIKDSTTAFAAALEFSSAVFAPCGTYRLNWQIANKTNIMITGAGTCTALRPMLPDQPVISVKSTNFSEFRDFSALGRPDGTASGVVVTGSSNTEFRKLYISGFVKNGLECNSGPNADSSGIFVDGGYYLANGLAGIGYDNCQDFRIADTNIGKNKEFGLLLKASNAGQIIGNYIWENGSAISGEMLAYDWFVNNRITQSDKEGFSCANCNFLTVNGNQSYENSKSIPYKFDDWKFFSINDLVFSNNLIFDWTGVDHTKFGLTIDGSSARIIISNNIFSNHSSSSMNINKDTRFIIYSNNILE